MSIDPIAGIDERLRTYVREYSEEVWPNDPVPTPSENDLLIMELRSDSYANAHVEGEHNANGICSYPTPSECGERSAAAEFVETR